MLVLSLLAMLFATSSASGAVFIFEEEMAPEFRAEFRFVDPVFAHLQAQVEHDRQQAFFQEIVERLQAAEEQLMFEELTRILEEEEQIERDLQREFADFIAFAQHNAGFRDELRFGNGAFFEQFYAQPQESQYNFGQRYPEAREVFQPRYEDVAFPATGIFDVTPKEAEALVAARIKLGKTTPQAEKGKKLNYFTAVGVAETATQDEWRTAYKKLALLTHPDKNKGSNQYEDAFKTLAKLKVFADEANKEAFESYQNKLQKLA